jgi:[histone H4]-lysine20 N-methyltransferase SETD8
VLSGRSDGLEVRHIAGKGRGVVTKRIFHKGEFVVEYEGELLNLQEARRRKAEYKNQSTGSSYMFHFRSGDRPFCIDATAESGKLGRLVNHSCAGNLCPQPIVINGIPRLVLIAQRDILKGEELLYDYGDRSKEALKYHPWLQRATKSSPVLPDSITSCSHKHRIQCEFHHLHS